MVDSSTRFLDHTVSFWYKPETVTVDTDIYTVTSSENEANGIDQYFLRQTASNELKLVFENTGGTESTVTTATALTVGSWYHVAVTLDAPGDFGTGTIFINGIQNVTSGTEALKLKLNGVAPGKIKFRTDLTFAGLYIDAEVLDAENKSLSVLFSFT